MRDTTRAQGTWIVVLIGGGLLAAGLAGCSTSEESATAPAASAGVDADEPAGEGAPADTTDWYTETYGTFEAVNQTGTGDSVVPLPDGFVAGILTATHDGQANFIVSSLDASNSPVDVGVNVIGPYNGTVAVGLGGFGDPTSLQVQADGSWTLTLESIATAPVLAVPGTGGGDAVFRYDADAATANLTHAGNGNFIVTQYGGIMPNSMVNEIGPYQGAVPLQKGPSVIAVQANGAWTVG
jgi:hypothetical protein